MFEVRVEAHFAAAHFLKNYHGKCENLHGHNYRVLAHARGNTLDEGGMLLDFTFLKSGLRQICNMLDHTHLNELEKNKISVFENNPSAEKIAYYIFKELQMLLPDKDKKKLYAVDVYETETSRARYIHKE